MPDVLMPQLSDSMEQGTVLSWLKPDGATIARGEELVEIETDKATMTYEADADGVLRILVPEGTTLAVGEPIARIGEGGEDAGNGAAPAAEPAAPAAPEPVTPVPVPAATNGHPESVPATVPAGSDAGGGGGASVSASPLARRLARLHAVDLATVQGSGPRGRITRADVARAAGVAAPAAPQPAAAPAAPAPAASAPVAPTDGSKGELTVQELSRLQQVIARRMAEAKATAPEFQVQTEVPMDAALALRAQLKQLAGEGEPAPSVNDLIVKAVALALRKHPRANGSYRDGHFELHGRVNVGVAVAADDALVVPTVFDADARSLGEIARETRRLAQRVRDGQITPPELSGGTFTVSNLGMFGMTAITPVLNVPQAGILGVGATREQLALVGGEVKVTHVMTLTLTCDHRILYGADAARFLADVRDLLAAPLRLAL